jgi:hypothetical protein
MTLQFMFSRAPPMLYNKSLLSEPRLSALRPQRALFPNSGPGKPLSDKGPLLSENGRFLGSNFADSRTNLSCRIAAKNLV